MLDLLSRPLNNLSIRNKLFGGFGLILLLTAAHCGHRYCQFSGIELRQ